MSRFQSFLDGLNHEYERLHVAKEDAFWTAMMGLADDAAAAQRELDEREIALMGFVQDPERLRAVRRELEAARAAGGGEAPSGDELVQLEGWERTFAANAIDSAEGRALAEELVADEGALAVARGGMELGYRDPEKGFVRASSVRLGLMLASEPDARLRRAAWEGLRAIEPFVIERGFLDIVRKRNRLGRSLGGEDYYDWRVRRDEGMTKAEVFGHLDELEERTRDAARRHLDALAAAHGPEARAPWSVRFLAGGDVTREVDPYFPFAASVGRWGRSFAALAIDYDGAELVLDLVDRRGKYENGFMHGPEPAWRDRGARRRARVQFTSNAVPGMVGSGLRATQTLFHEGGHAAHFANVDMPAPCFAQEFAPTSVAFSETQSMLLDSLLDDADWRVRYARDRAGAPLPDELLERGLRRSQASAAWDLRAMLSVCYAERALYELPDDELTPERALAAIRAEERRLLLLDEGSPRPALSVPHLISGDASAYYHGYVLAEMAVEQTRAFFLGRDGHLVDNPRLGPDLRAAYWRPGNSRRFAELVERLVGAPPAARHLADRANRTPDEAVEEARAAVARLADVPPHDAPVRLNARVRIAHGRETVTELAPDGDFDAFSRTFGTWIDGLEGAAG